MAGGLGSAYRGTKKMGMIAGGMTVLDLKMNMDQGDSFGTAATKAGANYLAWSAAAPLMWSYTGLTMGASAVQGVNRWHRGMAEQHQMLNRPTGMVGGGYMDTSQAQTMRQAAVQAIQGSKLNARSALGGEARLFHQNSARQW